MSNINHFRSISILLLFVICLLCGGAEAQQNGTGSDLDDVGREDPFAELPKKIITVPPVLRRDTPGVYAEKDSPELFIETVTLKFLNAKTIQMAVRSLSSRYGVVVVDTESNCLIISDTKESLARIVKKVMELDKMPARTVSAEKVALKYLRASNVLDVLKNMSSPHGSISVDAESNSLIIRDTRENMDRIICEIEKIDRDEPRVMFVETITLQFLKAENLKSAIEPMCSEHGTISVDKESNSLIVRDTLENLERMKEQVAKLDGAPQMLFVETVTLKFLKAENLKSAMDSMSSEYGSIAVDVDTNSLVVCDTRDNVQKIVAEIRKADRTPAQIMIEVVIADVQLDDDTQTGVNLYRLFPSTRQYYHSHFSDSITREGYFNETTGILDSTLHALLGKGAHFIFANLDIEAAVHLLQEKHNVEILANPRVLVVSGQVAEIKTVEEIPYQERFQTAGGGGGLGAMTSIQFKEVGVMLNVKATLTDERKILLQVKPEQSVRTGEADVGGEGGAYPVPVVDTRSADSTLLMEDGQVVIMGGLRRKETSVTKEQVPLLGDIPVIGFFFSSNSVKVHNSELLVFISPHIYTEKPLTEEQLNLFNELRGKSPLSLHSQPDPAEELMSVLTVETE